jgi:hypothetical protein
MADKCRFCSDGRGGGYWDCGPDDGGLCGDFTTQSIGPKPDQDCCQKVSVLVRKCQGKCEAQLFTGEDADIPSGWTKSGYVTIQVQAGKKQGSGNKCYARVFVPQCASSNDCGPFGDC